VIADDRHALYCGYVFGLLMTQKLPVMPVTDDDGFTDRVEFSFGEEKVALVIPQPPEDWTFPDGR
jgi:hypothetical protein